MWVGDGLEFRLVNQRGDVEALGVAHVNCNARDTSGNGVISNSYFPLEPGNTWIYRYDTRVSTAGYLTWKVSGLQIRGTKTYSEITSTVQGISAVTMLLREETDGTLWRFTGTPSDPKEEIYLNPGATQHAPFKSSLGEFPDSLQQLIQVPLSRDTRVFVRGVGLVRNRADLLTGSSGGFVSGMELVEFHLASGPRVELTTPKIALSVESIFLNVTDRMVTNCVIPCYYPACGFGSPVDPVGTYRPCVRTRIEAAAEGQDLQLELTLRTAAGIEILRRESTLSGEAVRYIQLPLYSEPSEPFATGSYTLTTKLKSSRGDMGTASLMLEIR
jgi:hypothetical protein